MSGSMAPTFTSEEEMINLDEVRMCGLYDARGEFLRMISVSEALALFPNNSELRHSFPLCINGKLVDRDSNETRD